MTKDVQLRFHNSATRRKEAFAPLDPSDVRVYLCGPTVYDRAHIGNARNVIMFDVLVRLLRHVYGADHVRYARNFTDVEDKINEKAAATGRPIRDITEETIAWYHADMDALGNARPDAEPRATDHIGGMIAMIAALIDRGHAYAAEGHVLFDVRSYPDYGALSGRSVDDMIAGARVEVAPYKRDPMDFVLWKPSDAATPGWESPWGRGRPGWHIECSAMTKALFGPAFDIHGGGTDLLFPHHENEVAQSCCADPGAGFAQVWLHNEMLLVEGRKMSKSLGNFFTVRDLLDQGVPGEVIRLVFLGTHYRKTMDWTKAKSQEAERTLRSFAEIVQDVAPTEVDTKVVEALTSDLNTSLAITRLRELAKVGEAGSLRASLNFLGLDISRQLAAVAMMKSGRDGFTGAYLGHRQRTDAEETLINALQKRLMALRAAKNWEAADQLKTAMAEAGVRVLSFQRNGAPTFEVEDDFDVEQLEGLLE